MKLKELQEIITQLPINKRVKPNILGQKQDQVESLYHLLRNGTVSSEEEAIQKLLPNSKAPRRSLWKLKEKLIERVGNSALLLFSSKFFGLYEWKKIQIYKMHLLLKIYSFTPFKKLISYYGEKTFELSVQYQVTDLSLLSAIELRHYYGLFEYNEEKYDFYKEEVEKYLTILNIEKQLENTIITMLPKLNKRKHFDKETLNEIGSIIKKTNKLKSKAKSFRIEWYSSYIISICHLCTKDHENASRICENTLENLQKFSFQIHHKITFAFQLRKTPNYLVKKQFKQLEKTLDKCLEVSPVESKNYFVTKQIYILNLFHQGKFDLAHKVVANNFHKLNTKNETWEIYRAYAYILTGEYFRLARFLNQVPVFSKDKKGMNINIIIIPVLYYLRKKLYSKIIDRTDSIKRYVYRYLMDDESTYRSGQFLRLLCCLESSSFELEEFDKQSLPYLTGLKELPLHEAKQDYEVEVVPYELLWEFVRKCLQ